MNTKLNDEDRDSLLRQLRTAVTLQIELWGVTRAMAEKVQCELEDVTSRVQAAGITADTGLEMDFSDLDEFLAIGPLRITKGRPLRDRGIV